MDRKPTMHDVARAARVGTMTVSRVLNRSAHVSSETAERVYKAIQSLGYRPNEVARALRGLKTRTIGVIVPYLYDPFFATCAHAIGAAAKKKGYSVILATSNEDAEAEGAEAQLMLQRHVDGLVIIPAQSRHSHLTDAEFSKIPVVTLDRPAPDRRFDSVLVQNQSGAKLAVQHLIAEHGHKRVAFIALNRHLHTMKTRYEGYRRAMVEADLEPQASFKCDSQEATAAVIAALLKEKNPPTALMSANNLTMRYILRALLDSGIKVPETLALAGFDDFELAELLHPTLTVVRQPAAELGTVAAGLLFNRLAMERPPQTGKEVVLPVELVVRRSCGCK
ncbi:LacI family transcriptional regulator [Silvibacterium bohemicum]|uniref:LacI family transcriptional regulator n=1 Tax=Silvibacterium bohemicum TaxID=1577686 RepID=A0A841JTG8_9BACT|nr:LacI family DNA-binding transcriptional regulator [Silvibacterium bohemicum]MBB6142251.1 LacI family transcriptional regulator [Silvibacterium bohemicum]